MSIVDKYHLKQKVTPYSERLARLHLPSLYRKRWRDMILVYQLLHGMLDVDATSLFIFATYASTRGYNFKFCKPRARTNVRLHSFSNWVINEWNNLPADVVNAHSLSYFKNLLDKHWTDSQYDCID